MKPPPSKTPLRLDMPRQEAEGYRAFQDGVARFDYPLPKRTPGHSEWLRGWDRASQDKENRESTQYL